MKDIRQVWTPAGVLIGPVNSLVGKGESIINYNTGKATLVTLGKVGVDNQPSSVTSMDDNVIAGNDIDWLGSSKTAFKKPLTFALESAPITAQIEQLNALESLYRHKNKKPEMDSLYNQTALAFLRNINQVKQPLLAANKEITDRQLILHEIEGHPIYMYAAKHGKDCLERFKNGTIDWAARYGAYGIPTLLNGLQANYWAKLRIHMPDVYASNPYESQALSTLSNIHANPYNQLRSMQDVERRGTYSINQSGGYTGGQRLLARVALNIGLQRNYADILANANKEENQYRSNWANAALQAGAQTAQRRQAANQYNAEAYDRAASRRATNFWKSVAGVGQNIQQAFANEFKYRSFQDMMNLYNQDLDLRLKELLARYPGLAKTSTFVSNGTAPISTASSTTRSGRRFGPTRSPFTNEIETRPTATSGTPYVNTIYDEIAANNGDMDNTITSLQRSNNAAKAIANSMYVNNLAASNNGIVEDGSWTPMYGTRGMVYAAGWPGLQQAMRR